MAANRDASYKITGANELRKIARKAGPDAKKALRDSHKTVASTVAEGVRAPSGRTGRLAASVRPQATQKAAIVAAGSARVPYAGVIHYGNPTKKGRLGRISAQPFIHEALRRQWDNVWETYEKAIEKVAQTMSTGGR